MTGPPSAPDAPAADPVPERAVFRLPRSAYLAVVFLVLCVTVVVQHPALVVLYVIPLAVAVFVARAATVVDRQAITLRALAGSRRLPWDDVVSLTVDRRGRVSAVVRSGGSTSAWRLRFVRARHVPLLGRMGGLESPTP